MRSARVGLLVFLVAIAAGNVACKKKSRATGSGVGGDQLAVGDGHACLRKPDKSLWCWGSNRLGSVGVKSAGPSIQFHTVPKQVKVGPITAVAIAGVQTCFEAEGGGISCYGGGLSDDDADPKPLELLTRGRLVTSQGTGCVIDAGGLAACWGENENARISPGDTSAIKATFGAKQLPTQLAIGTPIEQIAIGGRHGCALTKEKKVLCWGLANFGQLGDGTTGDGRSEPREVAGLSDVKDIRSGAFHTCALTNGGEVWCWGRGDDGQLGSGEVKPPNKYSDQKYLPQPAKVEALKNVAALAVGSATSCALSEAAELHCWGNNDHGQIGDGTAEDRNVPVRVDLADVVEVDVGYDSTCARVGSGDVYCWGDGDDGKLGNGSSEGSAKPSKVRFGNEPAGPDPAKADLVEYESVACGFRVKLPGARIFEEGDDLRVDEIRVPSSATSAFLTTCFRREKMHDKTIDDLERNLSKDSAKLSRKKIDDAECLEREDEGGAFNLTCFTPTHFVDVRIRGADEKRANEIKSSLHFFDPKSALAPATTSTVAPPQPGMVVVPEGDFVMGCSQQSLFDKPSGELGCTDKSQPMHRVKLSAFAIDRTEVTEKDYAECVSRGACTAVKAPLSPDPQKPVRDVDWNQAKAYCEWRSKRLPTEAEWEKAARGTDGRSRPWGDTTGGCEHAALLSCQGPTAVGTHPSGKSPYGVEDMTGNVGEWVADAFGEHYYVSSPRENPTGPKDAVQRTVRGGSHMTAPGSAAVYHRFGRAPGDHNAETGFRCAQSLGGTARKGGCGGCAVPARSDEHDRQFSTLVAIALAAAAARFRRHGKRPERKTRSDRSP